MEVFLERKHDTSTDDNGPAVSAEEKKVVGGGVGGWEGGCLWSEQEGGLEVAEGGGVVMEMQIGSLNPFAGAQL